MGCSASSSPSSFAERERVTEVNEQEQEYAVNNNVIGNWNRATIRGYDDAISSPYPKKAITWRIRGESKSKWAWDVISVEFRDINYQRIEPIEAINSSSLCDEEFGLDFQGYHCKNAVFIDDKGSWGGRNTKDINGEDVMFIGVQFKQPRIPRTVVFIQPEGPHESDTVSIEYYDELEDLWVIASAYKDLLTMFPFVTYGDIGDRTLPYCKDNMEGVKECFLTIPLGEDDGVLEEIPEGALAMERDLGLTEDKWGRVVDVNYVREPEIKVRVGERWERGLA